MALPSSTTDIYTYPESTDMLPEDAPCDIPLSLYVSVLPFASITLNFAILSPLLYVFNIYVTPSDTATALDTEYADVSDIILCHFPFSSTATLAEPLEKLKLPYATAGTPL